MTNWEKGILNKLCKMERCLDNDSHNFPQCKRDLVTQSDCFEEDLDLIKREIKTACMEYVDSRLFDVKPKGIQDILKERGIE